MAADKQEFLDTLFGNRKSDYEVCIIYLCACLSYFLTQLKIMILWIFFMLIQARLDEFNKKLENVRQERLEERKHQRMAKRREDFIRARREEKRKEREEQMKRGFIPFFQFEIDENKYFYTCNLSLLCINLFY